MSGTGAGNSYDARSAAKGREYQPDRWVVIAISSRGTTIFKVFAGWSGGYLYGDSWRMNSGIREVGLDGDYYLFTGRSGSIYRCHRGSYGFTGYMAGIWQSMRDHSEVDFEVLAEDTDFMALHVEKTR